MASYSSVARFADGFRGPRTRHGMQRCLPRGEESILARSPATTGISCPLIRRGPGVPSPAGLLTCTPHFIQRTRINVDQRDRTLAGHGHRVHRQPAQRRSRTTRTPEKDWTYGDRHPSSHPQLRPYCQSRTATPLLVIWTSVKAILSATRSRRSSILRTRYHRTARRRRQC